MPYAGLSGHHGSRPKHRQHTGFALPLPGLSIAKGGRRPGRPAALTGPMGQVSGAQAPIRELSWLSRFLLWHWERNQLAAVFGRYPLSAGSVFRRHIKVNHLGHITTPTHIHM
jgi:hypothetical protein